MDLSYTLAWMVGTASGIGLLATLARHRLQHPGWLSVYAFNTIVVLLLAWRAPSEAGFIALAVWAPTVLAPTLGVRYASRLVGMQRYAEVRRLLRALAILHPFDGWSDQPDLLHGLALLQAGDVDAARQIFERARAKSREGWLGRIARLHLYRIDGQWQETRRYIEEHPQRAELLRDVTALSFYLRALGELEDVDALCRAYAGAAHRSEIAQLLPTIQLFVAAFAGRPDLVEQLFAGGLRHYSTELKAFWRGSAHQTAGDAAEARRALEPLAEGGSPLVRGFASRRLLSPLGAVDKGALSDASRAALDAMAREIRAARAATAASADAPIATITLVIINTIVFLRELPGGSMDPANLCRMGALILGPDQSLFRGEWWRVGAACFLHFGWVHAAMNMLGLAVLGRRLEKMTGALRFAIIYAAAGAGSGLVFVGAAALRGGGGPPTILVGASGCIMGVVGALAALLFRRFRTDKTRVSRAQLLPIVIVLVAQSIFDVMTPEVAMLVHLAGAAFGFVVGGALGEAPAAGESARARLGADAPATSSSERSRSRPRAIRRAAVAIMVAALTLGALEALHASSASGGAPDDACDDAQ